MPGLNALQHSMNCRSKTILQTIETNLTGAILLTRLVVPVMRQNGFGRIINLSSIAGKHGPAYGAVYGATKAGLDCFHAVTPR